MDKNEQVALKMGWKLNSNTAYWEWRAPNGIGHHSYPDYEQDIKAAWMLTEHLPAGWAIVSPSHDYLYWEVSWPAKDGGVPYSVPDGDTASAAIVDAFLAVE